jgi:hypothetical protein
MSDIVPTRDETELRDYIIGNLYWLGTASREQAAAWLDDAIVTHTRQRAEAAEATCRQWAALVQAAEREFPDLDTVTVDPSNTLLVDTVRRWVQMHHCQPNVEVSGSASAAPTVRTTTATKP